MSPSPIDQIRLSVLSILACIAPLAGQIQWSGDIAITAKGLDRHIDENKNFRGDDPFNDIRVRLMPRHWVNRRMAFFGELLYDNGSSRGSIRMNGAYVVVNELFAKPWLSLKAGLIPSPFGNYSLRSTYFNLNPLIGIPLMWHHRTPLEKSVYANPADLVDHRSEGVGYQPIGYDACWEIGAELFGEVGIIEYSFAMTEGTLSNPSERSNEGRQAIGRVGINPTTALRVGASIAHGPYLEPAAADSNFSVVEDFNATALGAYLEYKVGYLQLHSEIVHSAWESPYIDLSAWSGYVEGRYDLTGTFYMAARYDEFGYSTFFDPSTGVEETWGVPLSRLEAGVGYRVSREMVVKAVYQSYDYSTVGGNDEHADSQLLALQLHMVF